MVRGVGLDRIIERPREEVNDWLLTRRDFLKMIGITALTLAGVGFAGCSSRGSGSVEFKPQNPLQSGYRLIYPENSKPVPDDVIPHIEEIGKKYFEVWAPGDMNALIKDESSKKGHREIPLTAVTPGMIILGFTSENNYSWVVGDIDLAEDDEKGIYAFKFQYIKELASDIYFINQNIGLYGVLDVIGPSGNKAYANFTFIERGGGKVASFVYVQDLNDPENYERYAFHSKEKLNKMWIEITSAHNISKVKLLGHKLGVKPEEWYKIPDEAYKNWPPC